jgi:hypothetical protein
MADPIPDIPVYGVDFGSRCPLTPPCEMCTRPGRPCGQWEVLDTDEPDRFCPCCGWQRRYHAEVDVDA